MQKNEFTDGRKIFLIGAGFDRMFGLPNWKELYEQLKSYVTSSSESKLKSLNNKISLLDSLELNIARKFEMLFVFAKKHGYNRVLLNEALKKILDINKYADEHDIELMLKTFDHISNSNDIFITTNFSNVFQVNGWAPVWNNSDIKTKTFIPLHGLINITSSSEGLINNIVVLESEYLHSTYSKRINNLESIFNGSGCTELHIYGYSLNDVEILKKIYASKKIKLYIYISYENTSWRDLQKDFYSDFFRESEIEFVTPEWKNERECNDDSEYKKLNINPYMELLNNFKDACTKSNVSLDINGWEEEVE